MHTIGGHMIIRSQYRTSSTEGIAIPYRCGQGYRDLTAFMKWNWWCTVRPWCTWVVRERWDMRRDMRRTAEVGTHNPVLGRPALA